MVLTTAMTIATLIGVTLAGSTPVQFNATFGDNMVLQQAPAMAAVYGTLGTNGTAVSVTVSGPTTYTVVANISGTTWMAYLKPTAAGDASPGKSVDSYTITATCTGGASTTVANITNVVFGDVWYCAGQSNMWLPLLHTFSRNYTVANITSGKRDNIRLMAGNSQSTPFNPWMTSKQAIADGNESVPLYTLFQFSAACYYTAETLTDTFLSAGKPVPPLGLISTAIGGSEIEEWITNSTIAECKNASVYKGDETLYNKNVIPYLSMTVKGFLWYQGENDMHNVKGNSIEHVGYGCMMPALVSLWREKWSQVPGTTDPNAPFGLVVLPGSGGEGGPNMGAMRWAQTANYGVLPNEAMPNTFLAQAYDLDDPWANEICYSWKCCAHNFNKSACYPQLTKIGLPNTGCEHYCEVLQSTSIFMGGIHPRDKQPVGRRLGLAAAKQVYNIIDDNLGPTITGCDLSGSILTVNFDGALNVQDYNRTLIPGPNGFGMSAMQVLTNMSYFCVESICTPHYGPSGHWICSDGDLSESTDVWDTDAYNDQHFNIDPALKLQGRPPENPFDYNWQFVNVKSASDTSVVVDLSTLNGSQPVAIRYAWQSFSCCQAQGNTAIGISEPCSIEKCPIMSKSLNLPANPFIAKIMNGKCECLAPQKC